MHVLECHRFWSVSRPTISIIAFRVVGEADASPVESRYFPDLFLVGSTRL